MICASCGARIRADREWCLRCEKPLVAARARSSELNLPAWLKTRGGGTLIFGAVGALVLLFVGYTVWERWAGDSEASARPTSTSMSSTARTSPASNPNTASASSPEVSLWSATSIDATRKGGHEPTGAELAAARGRAEEALSKNPNDAEALNNLGLALERLGQLDDAIAKYTQAAQIGPRNWAYHFNLAHALAQRSAWDRAIGEYRIAASLYPTDAATQCNLATALQKKGDDAGAIPVFEQAIQLAPNEPGCHLAMAKSLEQEGRPADARREYQQYLDLAPSAPDAESIKSHLQTLGPGRS